MLNPNDIPVPAPPAGQRREVEPPLPISRRIKQRLEQIDEWHSSLRACDQAFFSIVALGGFAIGLTMCGIWVLDWFGAAVVSHLPGRF